MKFNEATWHQHQGNEVGFINGKINCATIIKENDCNLFNIEIYEKNENSSHFLKWLGAEYNFVGEGTGYRKIYKKIVPKESRVDILCGYRYQSIGDIDVLLNRYN